MPSSSRPHPPKSGVLFDEFLVILAQQGDQRAFARLYIRWNPKLLLAARRYTGNAESAQDLVQECWEGIWKGIARLQDPARFRSYAFAVLHRRGSNAIARAIKERERQRRTLDNERSIAVSNPPLQSDTSEVSSAFCALPPDQRFAAHLYFVEGLTLAEIADVQSIPLGTAKTRLFHARRKLKTALS